MLAATHPQRAIEADEDRAAEQLAELVIAIHAIDALAADPDLTDAEVDLRLAQYAACAAGEYCPEVAFDPTARSVRALCGAVPRTAASVRGQLQRMRTARRRRGARG